MALSQLLYGALKERWKASFHIPPGGDDKPETWEARENSLMLFLLPIWRNPVAYALLVLMSYAVTRDVNSALSLVLALTIYVPYARRDAEKVVPVVCGMWIGLVIDLRHMRGMLAQRENRMKILMLFLHVIRRGLRRVRGSGFEFGFVLLFWSVSGSGLWSAAVWALMCDRFMPCKNLLRRELWRYFVALCILWDSALLLTVAVLVMSVLPSTAPPGWVLWLIDVNRVAVDRLEKSIRTLLGLASLVPTGTVEAVQDVDSRIEDYVEPWLEQLRDAVWALFRVFLLVAVLWHSSPVMLIWLASLLFENPGIGEKGTLGLGDGEYVIIHRFLTIAYARTAACVVRGVLHTVAHTGLVCLRHRGVFYYPTVLSLSADVVTWGGLPAFRLHEAGDKILIGSVSSGLFDNEVELLPAVQIRVGSSVSYGREDGEDCMTGSPVYAFSEEYQRHIFIGLVGQLFEEDEQSTNQGVLSWTEEELSYPGLKTLRESATRGSCLGSSLGASLGSYHSPSLPLEGGC